MLSSVDARLARAAQDSGRDVVGHAGDGALCVSQAHSAIAAISGDEVFLCTWAFRVRWKGSSCTMRHARWPVRGGVRVRMFGSDKITASRTLSQGRKRWTAAEEIVHSRAIARGTGEYSSAASAQPALSVRTLELRPRSTQGM